MVEISAMSWCKATTFGVRRSAFNSNVQRSTFNVRRSTLNVPRSTFGVRRSAGKRSPFAVRRSPGAARRSASAPLDSIGRRLPDCTNIFAAIVRARGKAGRLTYLRGKPAFRPPLTANTRRRRTLNAKRRTLNAKRGTSNALFPGWMIIHGNFDGFIDFFRCQKNDCFCANCPGCDGE